MKPATVDTPGEKECQTAASLAPGISPSRIGHFRKCDGPSKGKALSMIDAAVTNQVRAKGCGGKALAQQAAGIGARSGMSALPAKCS